MKTRILKTDDGFAVLIPDEYAKKLNFSENEKVDIGFNLELTQILIGKPDKQEIDDVEADEDF